MDAYPHILGCLLGTAVGDAAGLRREGLSKRRAERMYGSGTIRPNLIFGRGFCSDDTEHTVMLGRALAAAGRDVAQFEQHLAADFRRWILCVPAGVGFATLRACGKLLLRFPPSRSGVYSAGNGPAMRAALLGVCADTDEQLVEFVRASTRPTHTDPKAEAGALLIAQAVRCGLQDPRQSSTDFLLRAVDHHRDSELGATLQAASTALAMGQSPADFAASQGWGRGVTGYVNQTVPAALYCWADSPHCFTTAVTNAVALGGDADTVGAITGAICGSTLGASAIPDDWLNRLTEWPRGRKWMEDLSASLATAKVTGQAQSPPRMHWPASLLRNIVFASIVLPLGFRRLLPPY